MIDIILSAIITAIVVGVVVVIVWATYAFPVLAAPVYVGAGLGALVYGTFYGVLGVLKK